MKHDLMIDVLRSGLLESQHYGSVAAVDFDGKILAKLGDPDMKSFIRSSVKPMQALPAFVDENCMKRFKFNSRERAYLVSSHSGERRHQEIGQQILDKLGITTSDLKCGIHPPFDKATASEMQKNGEKFNELCQNCSGNHMVMLALCRHKGWDIGDYINPNHPVQQEIMKWMSLLTDVPMSKMGIGSDGCTVPVFHLSLKEMAVCWARFSASKRLGELPNPNNLDIDRGAKMMRTIMMDYWAYPEIISGKNRFDGMLNKIGKGRFFAKGGGEGLQLLGIADKGIGIAVKILDGDPFMRAKCTAVVETLHQLGLISDKDFKKIEKTEMFYKPDLSKMLGGKFQTVVPRFKVQKMSGWDKYF